MKPKIPNQKKAYNALNTRLGNYMAQVQNIYDNLCKSLSAVIESVGYDGGAEFSFSDYPELKASVDNMMYNYASQMNNLIYSGTSAEWKESNLMQDLLARKVLKAYDFEKGGDKYNRYFQTNNDALKAFNNRKDNGMNLSKKLWVQSEQLKTEMECAISAAIERGTSAITLSKRLSQYLVDFPSMQASYTAKFGHAAKCRDCQYASMRLARTEINMAYRTAEQERWKQFDFILGYVVKLSKRHPAPDICDDLQGEYPKDFKFVGWHPNCMCYVIPIVMSDEEYYGPEEARTSKMVSNVPEEFTNYMIEHEERFSRSSSLPYFVKDNPKYIPFKIAARK